VCASYLRHSARASRAAVLLEVAVRVATFCGLLQPPVEIWIPDSLVAPSLILCNQSATMGKEKRCAGSVALGGPAAVAAGRAPAIALVASGHGPPRAVWPRLLHCTCPVTLHGTAAAVSGIRHTRAAAGGR
jgi:hypothetical protein